MTKKLTDWFAVFRTGTHTDRSGRTRTFTGPDLDAIAADYEAASASCVINHEQLYSPFSYAQIAAVERQGDLLMARCDAESIEPQFAALVDAGRLHNRSVQLVRRAEGGLRLGHVAFLGAEPPAVEGLPPLPFSAEALTYSTDEAWERYRDAQGLARLWSALRSLARRTLSADEADAIVSDFEVDAANQDAGAAREAATRQEENAVTTYSQQQLDDAIVAERQRLELQYSASRREADRGRIDARITALIDAGRLVPAQTAGLTEFALGLDAGETLEFSREGQPGKVKTSPREYLFGLLGALPQQIAPNTERAGAGSAPPGAEPGADAGAIRAAALEYQAAERGKGRHVNIVDAVRHVTAEGGAS